MKLPASSTSRAQLTYRDLALGLFGASAVVMLTSIGWEVRGWLLSRGTTPTGGHADG